MKSLPRICWMPALITLFCVSCGDDPLLVEKREKQKTEIARLNGELVLMEEKLKNMPPDVSVELEEAKKRLEKQKAEVSRLDAEVSDLEARKRSLQNEFDSYRAKYQVK